MAAEEGNGPRRIHRRILPWRGTCATVHLPDTAVSDFSDVLDVCHRLVHELERDALSVGLEFVDDRADFSDDALVLHIAPVQNDLAGAHALRAEKLLPAVRDGLQIVLDFTGVRFVLTSIAAALLAEVFRIPGALTKLSFRNCTRPTEMAIRTVAASSRATYRRRPE